MNNIQNDFKKFALSQGVPSLTLDEYKNFVTAPYILEERKMNCQSLDLFSRLLSDRIIFFSGQVTEDSSNIIIAQLLYLNSLDDDDIKLYISSPGGDCYSGLSVVSTMDFIENDVSTVVVGMAASMGAVIASSGTKGKRYILPYSRFMIHEASSGFSGKSSDMSINMREMMLVENDLFEILAKNSNKSLSEIRALCAKDKWYKDVEAIENGFIDHLLIKKS